MLFKIEEQREVGGEHARLRGDRSETRADERKPDHEAQERQAEGAFGDIGSTGRAGIARAERGIGQCREQRRDERHDEGEPDGIADLPGGLADQPIDAGAEHAAEPVKGKLHRADGAVELWALPLFGWMARAVGASPIP